MKDETNSEELNIESEKPEIPDEHQLEKNSTRNSDQGFICIRLANIISVPGSRYDF